MFFREVRLVRCNRTSLNGSESITIRPSVKTQMVLGTNSSGKSSLLSIAFSPLPPDKNWFDEGGSLYQLFDHKGHTYEILCEYGDKNSYSFIVDGGENLNKSRTVSAQFELVRIHLGYTKEFHNLATGLLEFTQMGPKARQDWIAKFSPTNFDYAFAKYAYWRKTANSKGEIVKYLKGQLAEARENLIDPADLAAMKAKAAELHEALELLMREPRSNATPLSDDEMRNRVDDLNARMIQWLTIDTPSTLGAPDIEELITRSADLGDLLAQKYGELKVRSDDYAKQDSLRERAEKSLVMDPQIVRDEIVRNEEELNAIPELVCGLHPSLLIRAPKVISELRMAVAGLPEKVHTVGDMHAMTQGLFEKKERLTRITGALDDINRQIEHIHNCETIECPSCRITFKPGIPEGHLDELRARAAKGAVVTNEMSDVVAEAEAEMEVASAAVAAYAKLDEIRSEYQSAFPGLFAYLDNCGWAKAGRGLSAKLAIYERDVIYSEQRINLATFVENLRVSLLKHEQHGGEIEKIVAEYEAAKKLYEDCYEDIQIYKDRKNEIDSTIRHWTNYEGTYAGIMADYDALRGELINYCSHQGDEMLEDLILKTKKTIGVHEYAISEQETHETRVKDLENQLRDALIQEDAYKRLTAEMCPKKGFLAEQIGKQMAGVVNVVNAIIRRVWGYPLHLLPCGVDDTEIDYKFPIMVDKQPRDDISEGSRSVKDVINQAFRLAAYYCMKLTDYPLFLDEIGSSFDEAHRHNLIPLIKDLVDDEHFSQVLLVSHSLDGQTSFPMSETIIMDDRNLSYPHAYNLHVEFA